MQQSNSTLLRMSVVTVVTVTLFFSGRTATAEVSLGRMMRNCLLLEDFLDRNPAKDRDYCLS